MRQHYLALDGLRGFAAIAVVAFHIIAFTNPNLPFSSAYLSVDLFFALSGFVLSAAYSMRLGDGMQLLDFMRLRLIRLYPAYLVGLALGVAAYLITWSPFSFTRLFISLSSALLFLPLPVPLTDNPPIFPLNLPAWSLFFELFVNLVFVAFYRYLTGRTLIAILFLSGANLIAVATFHGNLHVGWNTDHFFYGLPRSLFSFFAGVLVHRCFPTGLRSGGAFVAFIVALVLVLPIPANIHSVYDPVVVVLLFPIGIAAIAGWELQGLRARVARALGVLSYPLYVIHMPCIYIVKNWTDGWRKNEKLVAYGLTISALVIVSWLIAQFIETPIRRWLSDVRLGRGEELRVRENPTT
jgi:peptidoglycan/LPS O-acetylase OafA/YrhL